MSQTFYLFFYFNFCPWYSIHIILIFFTHENMYKRYAKKSTRKVARRAPRPATRKTYARVKAPRAMTYRAPTTGIGRTGLPSEYPMQFRCADEAKLAPNALYKNYVFKCNSLFEPFDSADMKTQAVGIDQMYYNYLGGMVFSGRYKVTFVSTVAKPSGIAMYLSGSSAAVGTTIKDYMAQPGARYKVCGPTGSSDPCTLIMPFKTANVLGPLDKSEHGSAAFKTTSPSKIVYLHVIVASSDATNLTGELYVESIQNALLYDKVSNKDAA